MLFNSIYFFFFLVIVFTLYWISAKKVVQNIILLASSYFFYSCWDYRFLFLLIFSTFLDYYSGIKIHDSTSLKKKNYWFWASIIINLGFLGIFKYYNFFIESFTQALSLIDVQIDLWTLQVILPVGISFYTFHGLSYVIDIKKDRIKAERNFINYAVFVSFFPLLVAGPIERATHLLPQIKKERIFNYSKAVNGLRQILWGLFKKVVIADQCAELANVIFNNSSEHSGLTLLAGAFFFTIQIYGDFSGYSDIALGTAKLFGIELIQNFSFPYFSRNIAEFWRKWHISLSSWFRDYLYIPLGGSKGGNLMKIRNTFVIFIVSGFWHGANWTFIVWGFINALYIMPSILLNKNKVNMEVVAKNKIFPSFKEIYSIAFTFALTLLAWIFFRAENLSHAISYIKNMLAGLFTQWAYDKSFNFIEWNVPPALPLLLLFGFLTEWAGRDSEFALQKIGLSWPYSIRIFFYVCILMSIFIFAGKDEQFIYFQF